MHKPIHEREVHGGVQKVYRFANNLGASVVKHKFSYGHERNRWELGVIKFNGPEWSDFKLTYDTPITSDVIGHLPWKEIEPLLTQIEALNGQHS